MARARRKRSISAEDLDRLGSASGADDVDLSRSLLGPSTVTWRVNRELALLGGGGCALLMQVAHPLVAAGVERYSNFRNDPLQRLVRTLDLMLTISFSPAADAIAAVREIERRHARVRGRLEQPVGNYRAGTAYDANDPHLQLWVHATLVDTALRVYEMFIGTLSNDDRDVYYEESKIIGRVLGIPNDLLPRNRQAFRSYLTSMLEGDTLAIGPAGRAIAESILAPERPFGLKFLLPPLNLLTTGLLPESLRAKYGYEWSEARALLLRTLVTASQLAISVLPNRMRFFPHAYRALNHESLRRPEGAASEAVA